MFLVLPALPVQAGSDPQQTLIMGRSVRPVSLDPALARDRESSQISSHIFETLVRVEDNGTGLEPGLAQSWAVTPEKGSWIFFLRPGVFFHDGTEFDAEAAAFSLARLTDPNHPYFLEDSALEAGIRKNIQRINVLDRLTLLLEFHDPSDSVLSDLAHPGTAMVSPGAVEKHGPDFGSSPVGTGPFRHVHGLDRGEVILEKNPSFWGPAPILDRVVYRFFPDNMDRFLAFKNQDIHVLDGIEPTDMPRLTRLADIRLFTRPGMSTSFLVMNVDRPPLDNILVRRSISRSINKEGLVKYLYQGHGVPASGLLPPSMEGFRQDLEGNGYDPAGARELLMEAGLPGSFKANLWVMDSARPYLPRPVEAARLIKAGLAESGIQVQIMAMDWVSFVQGIVEGRHDLALLGWSPQTGDPVHFLDSNLGPDNTTPGRATNVTFWQSPVMGRLLDQARASLDSGERTQLLYAMQELISQEIPLIPLAHPNLVVAAHGNVTGIIVQPNGILRLHSAAIKPVGE